MKNNRSNWLCAVMIMGFIVLLSTGCKKDSNDTDTNNQTQNKSGLIFNSNLTYGTLTDIDGNVYKTIKIGTQTWMAENLKVTRYTNGDSIGNIYNATQWSELATGAYCNYGSSESNANIYGRLYNWYAVTDSRNLAPTGWHIPSYNEWETLYYYLGGYMDTTSDAMRETGTTHWAYYNPGATNKSGFTAIPGGLRDYGGDFSEIGQTGFWWCTDQVNDYYNLDAYDFYIDSGVNQGSGSKKNGMSVRCIKD